MSEYTTVATSTGGELLTIKANNPSGEVFVTGTTVMPVSDDTREKLEADAYDLIWNVWAHAWNMGSNDDIESDEDYLPKMLALLDRQKAITEREIHDKYHGMCLKCEKFEVMGE